MTILYIGCCGAYCKTCPELRSTRCQGCKIGYENGKRDIRKAKCKMKVCCIEKKLNTCADCDTYSICELIQGFYGKKSYKYKKYEEATLFIKEKGYSNFLEVADGWKNQYGKYGSEMARHIMAEVLSYDLNPGDSCSILCKAFEISDDQLKWRRKDLCPAKWILVRIDDNGNEFEMYRFMEKISAELAMKKYDSKGHKQKYLIKEATEHRHSI